MHDHLAPIVLMSAPQALKDYDYAEIDETKRFIRFCRGDNMFGCDALEKVTDIACNASGAFTFKAEKPQIEWVDSPTYVDESNDIYDESYIRHTLFLKRKYVQYWVKLKETLPFIMCVDKIAAISSDSNFTKDLTIWY